MLSPMLAGVWRDASFSVALPVHVSSNAWLRSCLRSLSTCTARRNSCGPQDWLAAVPLCMHSKACTARLGCSSFTFVAFITLYHCAVTAADRQQTWSHRLVVTLGCPSMRLQGSTRDGRQRCQCPHGCSYANVCKRNRTFVHMCMHIYTVASWSSA